MRDADRKALIRQAVHDTVSIARHLTAAIARTRAWVDDGHPSGGPGGVRGGTIDPLPLRKVLAIAGGDGEQADTWDHHDQINAKLFELHRSLEAWAQAAAEIRAFIAWTEASAKHEDDRPTAACRDCGRTILLGWDALYHRFDSPQKSRCTYRIDDIKGEGKVLVDGGCHAEWLAAKREADRIRQANWRAQQRDVTHHELAGGAACHAARATVPAELDQLRPEASS